jgi:hypothetical protein
MNVVLDELIEFCKFFKYVVEIVNTDTLVRRNILSFNDILYCCMYINGNSWSYSLTNIIMRMDNTIINVSDNAFLSNKKVYKIPRHRVDNTHYSFS